MDRNRLYCKNGDRCSNLSVLVYGKMKIINSKKNIDNENDLYNSSNEENMYIYENEFIDSSQWMLRDGKKGKRFTYSIITSTDCKYLTWPREILTELLKKHPGLEQPLSGALGIDVSNKVLVSK